MGNYRVGLGFDVHRFSKKKKDLILGGVKIPYHQGLEAVSDGDVVLHSIGDGLCGALGLGDIGDYFPPSRKYSNLDSKKIINFVLSKLNKKYRVVNIDITIIAERPLLHPYKSRILNSLKELFDSCQLNLKIKSKEGLKVMGDKNSLCCLSVVLLERKNKG